MSDGYQWRIFCKLVKEKKKLFFILIVNRLFFLTIISFLPYNFILTYLNNRKWLIRQVRRDKRNKQWIKGEQKWAQFYFYINFNSRFFLFKFFKWNFWRLIQCLWVVRNKNKINLKSVSARWLDWLTFPYLNKHTHTHRHSFW